MINKHDGVDFSRKRFWIFDENTQTVISSNLIRNYFRGVPYNIYSAMYWKGELMQNINVIQDWPQSLS